jgi:hypothetical protein
MFRAPILIAAAILFAFSAGFAFLALRSCGGT